MRIIKEHKMTVRAYLFQSPYSQPFQVGRPDPSTVDKKENTVVAESPKEPVKTLEKAQFGITSGNAFSINMGSLQQISSQSGIGEMQSINRQIQAQKAYATE